MWNARVSSSYEMICIRAVLLGCLVYETLCDEYCSIECSGERHTMCMYNGKNQNGNCKGPVTSIMAVEQRQMILDKHNQLRNKVAMGKQADQPPAANMELLNWDDELEVIAQRWADQCTFEHDKCRNARGNVAVGQNLGFVAQNTPVTDLDKIIIKLIQDWYDEVKIYRWPPGNSFRFNAVYGHYTQLVWGATDKVGCGVSKYKRKDNGWHEVMLVCNYKPAGNIISGEMYAIGAPCSACKRHKCNDKYRGLCGKSESPPITVNKTESSTSAPLKCSGVVIIWSKVLLVLFSFL